MLHAIKHIMDDSFVLQQNSPAAAV